MMIAVALTDFCGSRFSDPGQRLAFVTHDGLVFNTQVYHQQLGLGDGQRTAESGARLASPDLQQRALAAALQKSMADGMLAPLDKDDAALLCVGGAYNLRVPNSPYLRAPTPEVVNLIAKDSVTFVGTS